MFLLDAAVIVVIFIVIYVVVIIFIVVIVVIFVIIPARSIVSLVSPCDSEGTLVKVPLFF